MRYRLLACLPALLISLIAAAAEPAAAEKKDFSRDGNRLTYLDEVNPYYVGRHFPKLVTPQWVGEEGVEAVVILGIDDMRDPKKYEAFLRPILNRLKKIDGRAPVSIMTCSVDPKDPQLQAWLKEGLSLESHTIAHPCPLLKDGDFKKAKATYDDCVDLLNEVPGNKPVAFRVPCCDSLNTPSPRFYAEIFNKITPKNHFLSIDTSVFNIFTSNDPELPRELVIDADGQDRFRKYVPYDRSFVNTIEDYPYPYVIGKLCWEFPCVTPSDWQAQHYHKPNNPITVRDWKAALDCTVIKQGVFCLVFHPHGWIKNEQIVDLIDHAVEKHGKKVKFLTFKEAQERLDKHMLGGQPLRVNPPLTVGPGWDKEAIANRHHAVGRDNGVRLLDLDNDGYLDVVIGNSFLRRTRTWSPKSRTWLDGNFPVQLAIRILAEEYPFETFKRVPIGFLRGDRSVSILLRDGREFGAWYFDGKRWIGDKDVAPSLLEDWPLDGHYVMLGGMYFQDVGARLRDLDHDGICELIISNRWHRGVFKWSAQKKTWTKLPFALPREAALNEYKWSDAGVRFVDVDEDGFDDIVFSSVGKVASEDKCGIYLFANMNDGWSRKVLDGKPGDNNALPLISRKGENMGFWPHSRHLWWQNENTNLLPNLVDRRSFNELLADVEPMAKSPEASLKSWQPRAGFTVELMAAEPLVQDPTAFAWGPDGKLWVVEMADYPLGLDGKGKPGGRVKYLESTKGDGRYDKATLFLDSLPVPTGVLPWKKGAIVIAAPDIFYAEDTDGDGKADRREVLFTGFSQGNQQHRVNSLAWGLDNWIYCANGDSGGKIKSMKASRGASAPGSAPAEVDIRGRDFRIRPDTGEIDLQAGQTQYGRCRDDWGNWFGNNNSNPTWHFALADHYIRRNPHLAAPEPRVQVSVTPGAAPVFPISRTLARFNNPNSANHFTSACSPIVYRDELFGAHFANYTFVCEPVHNLVHREIMTPNGFTFTSRRPIDEQKSEFLASSDNWSRPAWLATGPDGAVWVADMYRHVIEHPEWIPKDWQQKLDLRAGHDKGRIYRVYPAGAKPRAVPRLDKLDTAGLVAALDSPSGWQRDMAQMMLIWKQDKAAVPLLEKMATREGEAPAEPKPPARQEPRPPNADRAALARLQALCTLDGLNALTPTVLQKALADSHPGVRRHAIRLCEPMVNKSPELGAALLKLVSDSDPQVRMQLAYTLGEWHDPQAGKGLGQLALQDGGDRFLLAAVMSSINKDNLDAVLLTVLANNQKSAPPAAVVESLLRLASAFGQTKAFVALLNAVATPEKGRYAPWQFTALAGLLDALDQRNTPLAKLGDSAEMKSALKKLDGLFAAARATMADKKAAREDQLLAIRLLGRGLDKQTEDIAALAALLTPQTPDNLQAAAVAALGKLRDPKVPQVLLAGWKGYGPAMRSQVLDVLFLRVAWLGAILDAIDKKQVSTAEIDATRRQRLVGHKVPEIRNRAGKLFALDISPDRQKVIESYQAVLTLAGDARRGLPLFTKHCANCHKLGNVGNIVGPDLASLGDKSLPSLLIAVLDPNRNLEARYVNYVAVTKSGLSLTGILASETGNSITLLAQDGKQHVILRGDLDELISTGKSPMPEGIEKDVKPQDLADLFAFIRQAAPPAKPKSFDGNKPELVRAGKDGSLLLTARNCEVYGTTLVFEKHNANLGYWNSDDDHAAWTVEVPKAGKYAVWLDWACADGSANKLFLLQAGVNQLSERIPGTGGWENYKQEKFGDIILAAGQQRITFRAAKRLAASSLIDLRSIKLKLVKE